MTDETYASQLASYLQRKSYYSRQDWINMARRMANEADGWKDAAARWKAVADEVTGLVRQINKDNSRHVERMAKLLPYGACGDEPEPPTGTVH
jgi:hypothetical protein